ncbi:hypothetical protein MPNE_0757 [Mycoplasmoides pneumoniae FH]|uniref:Uncharacterized protein n=1 Tax=Mycoplasmoides pneumoniae (strain ATCC 15531 / DSM 23978 / CIP 103766 / NBRC 14401 / NCTC 10119 / FH) TaxID=722438 RepID=A0A0H3DLP7_MYCPB|nr:hypothetical protein MPNE_0757 [Mycoplasmoides pneumoniae FH]
MFSTCGTGIIPNDLIVLWEKKVEVMFNLFYQSIHLIPQEINNN